MLRFALFFPPDEGPPLFKDHLCVNHRVVSQEGDYCITFLIKLFSNKILTLNVTPFAVYLNMLQFGLYSNSLDRINQIYIPSESENLMTLATLIWHKVIIINTMGSFDIFAL